MTDPLQVLTQRLAAAMESVGPEAAGADPIVRQSDRSDYQANGVMGLAKRLGANPREVAQQVVDAVDLDGIATVEIAGPG
ncbi:MAG: arginine--tRNA ligase, partial [Microthrixaceae bacterium]|nr:arginine--tRNA ligase [Microthrixaceae bacterium]